MVALTDQIRDLVDQSKDLAANLDLAVTELERYSRLYRETVRNRMGETGRG